MLKRQRFYHQVAIAGQVRDAITGEGIAGAMVKIIDAPDEFINFVIFQLKLFGLPSSLIQWHSFNPDLNPPNLALPQELQELQKNLKNPSLKATNKLELFQVFLENSYLSGKHKFLGFQEIIDYFPLDPKTKNSHLGRTKTAPDGWFYFMDLPAGLYRLEASLSGAKMRYIKSQCQVEIGRKNQNNIINQDQNVDLFDNIRKVELQLKPTTLRGKITNADDTEAIGMARVQILGSGEYTFSSIEIIKEQQGEWNYQIVGIEGKNTPITVIVSAKGYPGTQKEISLQPGDVKSLDFQLTSN
ncbi:MULTISPECIES: carboxypeptidase regulatory-like domain-containing protein [Aphanizomenonaceae]|uniref:Carboxypeptidase regulatory-like domain-containing protein n=1 Tax=Dolichospermum heterosporum TAC447 TaxID=747523 RepID=A0ABY5LTY6_9CYAN|nr:MULTISPECIES: carboxypeptidase regulatory-like domain-containing protein [Aphanizomenonaceae]UUO14207.1 carboxypeptidase regulatory-like domain-containing protein [Dolichospermum heterosporum TAC447]